MRSCRVHATLFTHRATEVTLIMADRRVEQAKLFYEFSLERHVPEDHLLRTVPVRRLGRRSPQVGALDVREPSPRVSLG